MLKYTETQITFAEIPNEINLCFSISNCAGLCRECHSPELRENIGKSLAANIITEINKARGITCLVFLGEGRKDANTTEEWRELIAWVRELFPNLKFALYSGRSMVEKELWKVFDYIKIGPYIPELGPLSNPNTNQRLYITETKEDITYKFWKKY